MSWIDECIEEIKNSGGSVSYYKVSIDKPTTLPAPYEAECNDIIEAVGMNFAEGNIFKALWRRAAARRGVRKGGYDQGKYDAEKILFFAQRLIVMKKGRLMSVIIKNWENRARDYKEQR